MPITTEEQRFLDAMTLDAPWDLVTTFAGMHRWKPEDVNKAADVIVAKLRRHGIPVEVNEPEICLSVPMDASVTAGGVTYRAKPPSSALPVPGGRTAPLVKLTANPKALRSYSRDIATLFGGSITSVAHAKETVGGKIVIMQGFGNPALTSLIEEWGGLGLIAVNPGIDIHWGTCTTIWGSPDLHDLPRKPKIPVVAVNNPDGQKLMALAEAGGEATIMTDMLEGWFPQKIPVVTIPGSEDAQKFVLLHGHYDSWEVGVGDNATGDATMLEIARVLWARRGDLKRGVKIAWWPGHSTGRYAGSTWFTDAFATDLDENCLAQVNCDSPGCRWATSYHQTRAFTESAALATQAIRDIVPDADIKTMRPPQAGDYSFNNIGLPSFFMLSSTMPEALRKEKGYYDVSGCGANIAWHTENDTLEIADQGVLMTDMKIYLLSILRIVNAEVLPFDWIATCDEFDATIAKYEEASKGAANLAPAKAAVAGLRAALAGLEGAPVAARNAAVQELSRILVPINYTREARFAHDPAYTVPPLPGLAVAAELATLEAALQKPAQVELLRGQNRFVAALRAATRRVQQASAA
ncbi:MULTISPECIES: M28 family metallopeptidase [Roseomonadaceae]|uniref:Carboxypeptidase Q n=1 Tax=Falsiroseomonas oleicola TaxID=2801474 RepID=A0ABS6HD34_9PROT|nr:M28 family peptidase [Roseomonas oleicola]MBU8546646.1 M28 family peptidase [Roseomonas oleicola]